MAVTCPNCRYDNSDSQEFCGSCGTQLPAHVVSDPPTVPMFAESGEFRR